MLTDWLEKTRSFVFQAPLPPVVALDLEARKLRVVHADAGRDGALPRIRTLAAIDVPEGLDRKSAQAVGEFLRDALKDLGLAGQRVLMDVPRSQAVLKTITLPAVENERELPAMVRYQVEKELPFPLDQAVIDFNVQNLASSTTPAAAAAATPAGDAKGDASGKAPLNVLVAAVQRSVVEHHQQIADIAGFRLLRLGLRPYADMRFFEGCAPREGRGGNVLLVHVMSAEAEINVLIGGALAFSRSALVRLHDDDGRSLTAAETHEGLVVEVARSAQSAMSAHRGLKIDRVVVTGDTGQEAALVAALNERFRLPCSQIDPTTPLRFRKTEGTADPRGFSSALGLAIAHGSADRMPFDFLNPKNPPVERNTKQIRAALVAAAVGMALLLLLVLGISNRNEAEADLAALRAKYNELEKHNRNVDKLGKRVAAVEEWLGEGRDWLAHWASLSAHLPPATEAYVTSLKSNPDGSLVFTVKARASKVITDLSKNLREAGYDVKLGSETPTNDEFGYAYTTSVRIGIDPDMEIKPAALKAPPRPSDDGSFELIKIRKRGGASGETRTEQPRGENGEALEKSNGEKSSGEKSSGEKTAEKTGEGAEKSATTTADDAAKDGKSTSNGSSDTREGKEPTKESSKDSSRSTTKDSRESSKDPRYSKDSKDRYRRN